MEKTVILLVAAALLATPALAQEIQINQENLEHAKQQYNNNTDQLPGVAKSLIGDQRINIYLNDSGSQENVSVDMNGAEIDTVDTESIENSTLEVWVEREDIEEIAGSQKPVDDLRQKVNSEEIRYQAHGFVNQIKFGVLEMFL